MTTTAPLTRQQGFALLNDFFDKIYVITIQRAVDRREVLRPLLDGLNYQFFFGADKTQYENDPSLLQRVYDDKTSRKKHRYRKPMLTGEVACSVSHRMVYEDVVKNGYENVLVFEDDVVPDARHFFAIASILQELPNDFELLYWGYNKNELQSFAGRTKQIFYHILRFFGSINLPHSMIANLYARPFSKHLKIAGFHDMTHAYSISLEGAKKLLNLQTPIIFNSDGALSYSTSMKIMKGYITTPRVFMQASQLHPETYISLIQPNEKHGN